MVSELQPKTDFIPAEQLFIEDLDTLKVLADPLRLQICELMEHPTTVKRIAEKLDMLPTKLYYHINLLEKHDLIVLVDTRIVSGIIEKHYQIAAKEFRLAKQLLSIGDDAEGDSFDLTIGSIMTSMRDELRNSIQSGMVALDDDGERHKGLSFHMGILHLSDEMAASFYADLESLIKQYHEKSQDLDQKSSDLKPYRAMYMVFPQRDKYSDDSD